YQPIEERGRRPMVELGVSEGFTYTGDAAAEGGEEVSNMKLNDVRLEVDGADRVSTLDDIEADGESLTAVAKGTNLQGGQEDAANLVAYPGGESPMSAPECRVEGDDICWTPEAAE